MLHPWTSVVFLFPITWPFLEREGSVSWWFLEKQIWILKLFSFILTRSNIKNLLNLYIYNRLIYVFNDNLWFYRYISINLSLFSLPDNYYFIENRRKISNLKILSYNYHHGHSGVLCIRLFWCSENFIFSFSAPGRRPQKACHYTVISFLNICFVAVTGG